MKLILKTAILLLLFSCSGKKNEEKTDEIYQTIESVQNTDEFNNKLNTKNKHQDSLRIPIHKPEVIGGYDIETSPVMPDDSTKIATKKSIQKHKEIPPDGKYIYDIAYAEYQGRSMGEKVLVVIKGNTIKIISEGNPSLTAKKGEILDEGILKKHNKTGEWLISNNPSDINLDAYGGCAGIVMVIDFINKKYHTC